MRSKRPYLWGGAALMLFAPPGNAGNHGHVHGSHDHGHGHGDHAHEPEAHGHVHDHGDHGHEHGEERAIAFTVWTDAVEILAEHPFIVVGRPAEFVTHVTYSRTFLPRVRGPATFVMSKGTRRIEHVEQAPARNGIYLPELVFPEVGTWTVTLQIPMDGAVHEVTFPPVHVYRTQDEADHAPDPEEPEGFSFLKEQQWVIPFMVEPAGSRIVEGAPHRAVPESALVYVGRAAYVYVQLGGETFERRGVQVKGRQDGLAIIDSGLTEQDRVVTLGVGSVAIAHGRPAQHDEEIIVTITEEQIRRFGIVYEAATAGGVEAWLQAPGEIQFNRERLARVVPRVRGRVARIEARTGQDVRAGQVLAVIESRELADAKAEFLSARERHALARAQHEREERLFRQRISPEEDYLTGKEALANSEIQYRAARQKLHALGLTQEAIAELPDRADDVLTLYHLTAPFDGTVIDKHIVIGEVVDDASVAFVIADLGTVWVDLRVNQNDIASVAVGQPAEIFIDGSGKGVRSQVVHVGRALDPVTRTAVARIALDDPERRYRPGAFVTGRIGVRAAGRAIVVPVDAVQIVNDQLAVFIATPDGFILRCVATGNQDGDRIEILEGVDRGELIVVRNAFHLKAESAGQEVLGHGHPH